MKKNSKKFIKEQILIQELKNDFEKARENRKSLESQWQLNMNFMVGNQYSKILPNGSVADIDKQYYWQEKEVFNHIAPTVETRATRISKMNPNMAVVPASTDEKDMKSAALSKEILSAVANKLNLSAITKNAIVWSEITGTVFYKVMWNDVLGNVLATDEFGKLIFEGDIDVQVCSPFEIFPEDLSCETIEDQRVIYHAKPYHIKEIKDIWNCDVIAEDISSFSMEQSYASTGGLGYNASIQKITDIELDNHCLVIEKYQKSSDMFPNGRLTIVAGDTLLFDGDLPYINGEQTMRTFPFIKQISSFLPGNFFGISVVERLIPVQRAFNAVRNRKHEYMNKLAMGVLTVEDGSIDTEGLEIEGLSPGKVLIYRQGSNVPKILDMVQSTTDFEAEEERLLEEFNLLSGVSDLMSKTYSQNSNMSGTALQVLSEQDDSRLVSALDSVKDAMKKIAKNILRMYKQFAILPRLIKIAGENGKMKIYYWDKSELASDDVVIDTNTEIGETIAQKRTMVLELLDKGLLYDKDGNLSQSMRKKCLDMLGFGIWEHSLDINGLHINQAQEENIKLNNKEKTDVLSIDNHSIHIDEHIAYLLSAEFKSNSDELIRDDIINHIEKHKSLLKIEKESEKI